MALASSAIFLEKHVGWDILCEGKKRERWDVGAKYLQLMLT